MQPGALSKALKNGAIWGFIVLTVKMELLKRGWIDG